MLYKGVLFDLDGTLLDTRELIYRSFEHARRVLGMETLAREELLECWGEPLELTLRRWDRERAAELLRVYREYMFTNHDELVTPFPGVREVLASLKSAGIRLAVVTSKARRGTERGLAHTGLQEYFPVVITVDDTPRPKPFADPALLALQRLGLRPPEAVLVGDTAHDIQCARNAGITSAAVAWSDCTREELLAQKPDYFLESPLEVLSLVGLKTP